MADSKAVVPSPLNYVSPEKQDLGWTPGNTPQSLKKDVCELCELEVDDFSDMIEKQEAKQKKETRKNRAKRKL